MITRDLYLARNHFKRNCPLFRELDGVIDKIRDRITRIFVYEFCKLGSSFLFGRNSFQRVSVCREKTVNEKTSIEVKAILVVIAEPTTP